MNPSTALATVLVDELVRCGVREAVLCPGSRSAPLAYALQDADRGASDRHRLQPMFPCVREAVVAQNMVQMQRLALISEGAVEDQAAEFERGAPDQRQGHGIGEHGADRRGDDVAADEVADDRRHDDVEAEKGRYRGEDARRDAGRDRMRRGGQAQHALRDVLP